MAEDSRNSDLRATYDKIAEDWAADHEDDTWWISGTDKFISFLPAGGSILDAGCGSGTKSKYFLAKGFRVIGIDFSEKLLEISARTAPDGDFRLIDIRDGGKLKEDFDGIFSQASLLHIPKGEAGAVVAGLAARLRPGGHFYIAVKQTRPGKPEEEILTENDYGYEYSRFFSYYTLEEVKAYLVRLGMTIVWSEISSSSPNTSWIQVIGRK